MFPCLFYYMHIAYYLYFFNRDYIDIFNTSITINKIKQKKQNNTNYNFKYSATPLVDKNEQ